MARDTINRFRQKIFTVGVQPDQYFSEKRDVIFTNQAIFVLFLSSIAIFLANLYFGFYYRAFIPALCFFLLLQVIVLQSKHQYFWAKVATIACPFLAAIFSSTLFGGEAQAHYYLMATFALGIVLFPKIKQHRILLVLHLAAFAIIFYCIKYHSPVFPNQDTKSLAVFHIPFILLNIFLALSEFVKHYQRYQGKIEQLLVSIQDNTDILEQQKSQIESQATALQRTINHLEQEIGDRESMEAKLLESNKELQQFAYAASHDLKEPLRTISSFIQLLDRKIDIQKDKEAKEYFHFVVDASQRMSILLDDLLALSRLNRETELTEVNLNNTLELVQFNLNDLIERKEGEIKVDPLPLVLGNKSQLSLLFQNLLSNALKFTCEGVSSKIEVSCQEQGPFYQFEIKDNGIGIPPQYLQKVFVVFQRLNQKTAYEGTGIGLALCKKTVLNHGGNIWIESVEGEGTSVFFTLRNASYKEPVLQASNAMSYS